MGRELRHHVRPLATDHDRQMMHRFPKRARLGQALGVAAVVLSPATAGLAQQGSNLQALLAEARAHSHDLAAARHSIEAAEAQLDEATYSPFFQFQVEAGAAWVPDATGVAGYSSDPRNQLDRGFGPAMEAKLRGAIPLWTFGKLSAARDAARAGVNAAEGELAKVRNKLTLDVRRAYFGLQFALDVQQMISEGLPKLEQALTSLQERLDEGDDEDLDPVDLYRLQAAVLEVKARKSEATRLEQTARSALTLLTGREDVRVAECPLAPVDVDVKPAVHYVELAGGHRPEMKLLDAARAAKRAQADEKRARYFPDLAIGVEAEGRYIPGRTAFEHYIPYYAGAGLLMRWNLDFVGHYEREQRVEHEQAALVEKSQLAADGIRLDVETRYQALEDARRRVEAWDDGHKVARRWFVSAAQGYQVGTVTPKELVDGVSAYFKARFSHLQAILDLNHAVAALENAVGSPVLPEGNPWEPECMFETASAPPSAENSAENKEAAAPIQATEPVNAAPVE